MPRPVRTQSPALDFEDAESVAFNALLKGMEYNPREVLRPFMDPQEIKREADELAGSFYKFIPKAWPLIEPTPFVDNWHIGAIAEHLEAVSKGDILDLLITMPPRHSKSLTVVVLWPVWEWINLPFYRWLFSSYAFQLSVRDSIKRRKIIQSPWYQERWADRFALINEQNTKIRYENDKHGYMLASSVGGSNTGEGGERIVADDPHNVKKAESAEVRQDTVDWWNIVMSTRRNDTRNSARIVVQQRTHEADVAGDIIERGGYVHLNLPTEFGFSGTARCFTNWTDKATGEQRQWCDPRLEDGELLNPVRFGPVENEKAKLELGDYQYACTPAESPVLMSDWKCKPISEVRPGDEVLGFEVKGAAACKGEPQRQRLIKSRVLRTFTYRAPVHNLVMSSGRTVRCTADHKWWTRRHPSASEPQRKTYMPASPGRPLWFVCPPYDSCTDRERDLWHYLAGIVDGEGSIKPNILEITQSPTSNAPTFTKILDVLSELGLTFNVFIYPSDNPRHGDRGVIQVSRCREVYRKLLRFTEPGKRDEMLACMNERKERLASERDYVISMGESKTEIVYALETETGNYVVWGYASSNSQHGQNPTPPKGQIIQAQWLRYYGGPGQPPIPDWTKSTHQFTPLFSLDCTFKDHKDTDYVAGLGWAMFGADIYLMPVCIHARLGFPATIDAVTEFVGGTNLEGDKTFPGIFPFMKIKLVEDKANGPAVISTLRHRVPGMVEYSPGSANKESRLISCSWRFKAGNIVLPHESIAPWIKEYVYQLCAFPKAKHDDYVDATSQALLFIGGDPKVQGEPVMTVHDSRWIGMSSIADESNDSVWGSIGGRSIWRIH